jgi:hypothetical protein
LGYPGKGVVAGSDKFEVTKVICMLKQAKPKSVLAPRRKGAKKGENTDFPLRGKTQKVFRPKAD